MTENDKSQQRLRLSSEDQTRLQAELARFYDHLIDGGYAVRTADTKWSGAEWFVRFLNGEEFRNES